MATFNITIDDTLIPGIVAIAYAEGLQPADVAQAYAVAAATKACQDMKVGPYYEGPTPPRFNADGTPYDGTIWRVVQASGPDGQFLPDDPGTAEQEPLAWTEATP